MGPAMSVQQELMSIPDFGSEEEGAFAKEKKTSHIGVPKVLLNFN